MLKIARSTSLLKCNIFSNNIYCYSQVPGKIVYQVRQKNAKNESKVSIKKSLNASNTLLFGPIIRKTSRKRKKDELYEKNLINGEDESHTKQFFNIFPDTKIGGNDLSSTESELKYLNSKVKSISKKEKVAKLFKEFPVQDFGQKEIEDFPIGNIERTLSYLPQSVNRNIYNISIFEDGYKELPSVNNILQATMSEERKKILEKWEKNMIEKIGEDEFANYRKGLLDTGIIFHKCIEQNFFGKVVTREQLVGIEKYWKSVENALLKIQDISVLESRVIHPSLHYQGSVDCVATFQGTPVVVEFKTSSRPKVTLDSTYDDPLQLAAYLGALNYDVNYSLPNIRNALLVIAYSSGLPAHIHFIPERECDIYWRMWCRRLVNYKKMKQIQS